MKNISPFTNTTNTELVSEYEHSITSDSKLLDAKVENRICLDTGIIYNAEGARNYESNFYIDEYDLHNESALSEFIYYDQGKAIGIYDNIVDFILESQCINNGGSVLDIGCGKGLLLNKFSKQKPCWDLYAIEPSKNAIGFFKTIMPKLNVFNGNFEDSPYVKNKFDLVMANGVLEHVPNPVLFMQQFANCINDDGVGFIGVPNFATNPTDLYTFDHLTRFTEETIKYVFLQAGLNVVSKLVLDSRVPMWYILKKKSNINFITLEERIQKSKLLINSSSKFINETFSSYNKSIENTSKTGKIAIYGTGAIALLGFYYSKLKNNRIFCFIEDNQTLWGTKKYEVPILSPQEALSNDIESIVLSANPCYFNAMTNKLKTYLVSHKANLFLPNV